VIGAVTPGKPADIAGLKKDDRIERAGGREIRNSIDFYQELAAKPMELPVTYIREGMQRSAEILPFYSENGAPSVGIEFAVPEFRSPQLGPWGALQRSLKETAMTVSLTIRGFGLLFQGINLRNAVAGPLAFFRFLSFLSVVLFLMNLLPIPAMDGGQIVLFLLEKARGKSVSPKTIWRIQFIGFSVLIALSLFITFGDVLFFLGK
jgi:regulator of sigma E protease